MGINNLNKFLRNNCPQVYEQIHLSEYAFQRVAIDISLYLCKFKTVCGPRWLSSFINLVACLRRNEIHCVFIYDSGAPPEKAQERQERASQRDKNEEKVYILEEALNKYYNTGEIDQVLIDLYKKEKNKQNEFKSLLRKTDQQIDMKIVQSKIEKMRGYILNITKQDFDLTKQLFTILDVPYFDAPLEAETMCADLCKRNLVDAVLSEDTDVIAYDAPIFLSKINTSTNSCIRIRNTNITSSLELNYDELLDLCIMCGTDYNKNIPRIGPEKAYKYIKEYRNIEGIKDNTDLDISILKHIRTREIFKNYEQFQITYIPYCGIPNFEELKEFIFINNIHFDINGLQKSFVREIIIED